MIWWIKDSNLIKQNEPAARLERKSFLEEERREKDWERKADEAAQKITF